VEGKNSSLSEEEGKQQSIWNVNGGERAGCKARAGRSNEETAT
jgi:hypothetical protein